ncbi:MAG: hypothetical protein JWN40_4850, partial [Phycisphaerales bacterium]|nr:hypothetical protein [Phycisphaerales bacterium]
MLAISPARLLVLAAFSLIFFS